MQHAYDPTIAWWDALLRGLLGAGLLFTMGFLASNLSSEWIPSVVLYMAVPAAYLLVTAVARTSFEYAALGIRTRRVRPSPEGGERRPRPRTGGRPLG